MLRILRRIGRILFPGAPYENRPECASCTIYHPVPGNLRLGRNIVLNDAFLDLLAPITIGDDVFFGHNVKILTGLHDISQFGVKRQYAISSQPVTIERGAWIASFAVILPGTYIGENAVVGAGSVVSGRVEAYSVVAGNPAQVIKTIPREGLS